MEKTNRDKVADIHPKAKQKLDSRNTKLDEGSQFSENIFNTVREPLLVLDQDLRIVKANRSFYPGFCVKTKCFH